VRTGVFHRILLRIAVQSGPARAAYTYCFITPVHGIALLGIHVHKGCDASTPHFGTVSRKYSISVISESFIESIRQPELPKTLNNSRLLYNLSVFKPQSPLAPPYRKIIQELPPFLGVQ
jgi:hypothetical protein